MSAEAKIPGEWSQHLRATAQIQEIAEQVKPEMEEKTNKKYPVYYAIIYKSLVPCGATHYLIKVSVSNTTDECVHLWVFQMLYARGVETSLDKYQIDKHIMDPLEPF